MSGASINADEAQKFFSTLREPFNIEESAKRTSSTLLFARKLLQPWKPKAFLYMEKFFIESKVQFLDFDIQKLLKNGPEFTWTDELFIKKIFLDWSPYVSSKLAGLTTVYLADLRSSDYKNSLVAGYVFKSSSTVNGMSISPGYMVNLRDKNLGRIFRFLVITSGLDCMEGSTFGSLTLSMEVYVGSSAINPRKMQLPGLTLVANKQAMTILQAAPDKSSIILENIDLADILRAFGKNAAVAGAKPLIIEDSTELQGIVSAALNPQMLRRTKSDHQITENLFQMNRPSVSLPRNAPLLVSTHPVCGLSHFPKMPESPSKSKNDLASCSKSADVDEDEGFFLG